MIELRRIDRALARACIDFAGGGVAPSIADAQLDGAVAIHNILARHGVAYLADEVGMGKTYVALGVVALIRAMHPGLRVLYIAPRANIQRKWCERELQNFVLRAWKARDQRVRAIDDQPAAPFVACDRLLDWARKASRNPDRDVFLRMSSFSVGLRDADKDQKRDWYTLRDQLLAVAPFINPSEIDARTNDKERFKEAYARALNRLIPHYDLVVVDEAHNLKHGPSSGSTRNRLLATVLGGTLDAPLIEGPPLEQRFDRVLFLSATPLETDFAELGNQLRLFGFERLAKPFYGDHPEGDEGKKAHAHSIIVRRLATVRTGERLLAKTEYRREWRGGGVDNHDAPLAVPNLRQKLIVALMQKKVTELVKKRFHAHFQIGMLASFESFAESTSSFDDPDQTDNEEEREGIDAHVVTRIARSYRKAFDAPIPHPKMESVVAELAVSMQAGDKSLVFVRRVRSVDELGERLCCAYNRWLRNAIKRESPLLPPHLHDEWEKLWDRYEKEREEHFTRRRLFEEQRSTKRTAKDAEIPVEEGPKRDADTGGHDTFFSWFFRGEPRTGMLSGAAFRRNRLDSEGAALNLLFEENHVAALLGDPQDVVDALSSTIELSVEETRTALRELAAHALSRVRGEHHRSHFFYAFQEAALWLLTERGPRREDAAVVLSEWFPLATGQRDARAIAHDPSEYLGASTFFTMLRARAHLRDRLWPDDAPPGVTFRDRFRRKELRRVLMSSVIRLGHPMIDVWALGVRGLKSLRGSREQLRGDGESVETFAPAFLDLLERQLGQPDHTSARELALLAETFDLVVQANFAKMVQVPLHQLSGLLARVLRRQTPVAGMTGTHRSDTAVQQFRMPGYPFVMIATDILQEGEDLHTFCARVVHYGMAWTPSSTEQRTGRVDRIGSLVHRRLQYLARPPAPDERLQIYYPYLADTVERLQAERVFDRLNKFIRLTHNGYGKEQAQPAVDTDDAFARPLGLSAPIAASLETAFKVREEDLRGDDHFDNHAAKRAAEALAGFRTHLEQVSQHIKIEWVGAGHDARRFGTVHLRDGQLVAAGSEEGDRIQPIGLYLRADGRGLGTTLHIVSPIATGTPTESRARVAAFQDSCTDAKLTETDHDDRGMCLYAAEVQIRFHPEDVGLEETLDAIRRAATVADRVEREAFGGDRSLAIFKSRLERDAKR